MIFTQGTEKKNIFLGDFEIDFAKGVITTSANGQVSLQSKFLHVLQVLVENYPSPVSRDDLIDKVWDGNFFVGDKALNNAIWNLRNSLGSSDQTFIETKRGKGYQLLVEPKELTCKMRFQSSRKMHFFGLIAFAIILAACYQMFLTENKTQSSIVPPFQVETNLPGQEFYPVISQDDRYLAFIGKNGNERNIFLKDRLAKSQKVTQITFDSFPKTNLAWPSDGDELFFLSFDEGWKNCYIKKVNVKTSLLTPVIPCHDSATTYFNVSPDAKKLVYRDKKSDDQEAGLYLFNLERKLKKPTRLFCNNCGFSDKDVAFSPDSQYLAFTRRHHKLSEDIFLYGFKEEKELRLTQNEYDILGLDWRKDGDAIVFSSRKNGTSLTSLLDINTMTIKLIDIPGTKQPTVNNEALYLEHHATDEYIAYIDLNSDIKFPRPLLRANYSIRYPDYSRVKNEIVYISNEQGSAEVWSYSIATGSRKKMTSLNKNILYPKWSNDGNKIAFLMCNDDATKNTIYILDTQTKQITAVNSPFKNHNRPVWSNDDHSIITVAEFNGRSFPYQISIKNGQAKQLSQQQARFIQTAENNRFFFNYSTRDPLRQSSVVRYDNIQTVLPKGEKGTKYNWVVTDNVVYYLSEQEDIFLLKKYDIDYQSTEQLLALPKDMVHRYGGLKFIKDKNWIIFNAKSSAEVDIIRIALNDI